MSNQDITPKTYWEKRCAISEHLTEQLFRLVAEIMPEEHQEATKKVWEQYAAMQTQLMDQPEEVSFLKANQQSVIIQ